VRKAILADELLAGVLRGFDLEAHTRNNEPRGRPEGFEGVVLQTPMGVPVLVGAASEFGHLRRVSQGSDLFFQCKYDRGARVLLRTSLQRGTKGSRACTQFAADVAAWFSDARHDEKVPVAYTNARQGGGGSRCIKEDQRLGAIVARPRSVANVALAAQQATALSAWDPAMKRPLTIDRGLPVSKSTRRRLQNRGECEDDGRARDQ